MSNSKFVRLLLPDGDTWNIVSLCRQFKVGYFLSDRTRNVQLYFWGAEKKTAWEAAGTAGIIGRDEGRAPNPHEMEENPKSQIPRSGIWDLDIRILDFTITVSGASTPGARARRR